MNATPQTSATAVISLIFGILAWTVLPLLGAIVAIVTGHVARSEIRHSQGAVAGDGMAIAGLVLGWLQLLFVFLLVAVVLLFFGGLAFLANLTG
ncbi:DUF4190 domain-containing protein [Rehaibacterium terrae]|jgi:hypothetical protein|uniref:Putative membrane protein n=1 Tax=Rehaibacterium terrae TaxID=1341696 RepID=A0A7W8DFN2_9GAMM|nr:DUF4190 domain-containing protein [Rehaibacterium terrae]MBB5016593.1 putative membrane protein [Rehaibacterium terrae]